MDIENDSPNYNESIRCKAQNDRPKSPLKSARLYVKSAFDSLFDGKRHAKAASVDLIATKSRICSQSPPLVKKMFRLQSQRHEGMEENGTNDRQKSNTDNSPSMPFIKDFTKKNKIHQGKKNKSTQSKGDMNGTNGNVPETEEQGFTFTQITNRIAALTFETNIPDNVYKTRMREISDGLKRNFPDQYKIFNVSQKRSDLGRANSGMVVELGWPDTLAPPLDRLCSICKQIENWLCASHKYIAIIHCKGWCSRAAIVVAAYLHYTNICRIGAESVEDKFSMQLFSEKYLGPGYGQPSHKRYLKYFANLLLGAVKVNPAAIFLKRIQLNHLSVSRNAVVKIYERMKLIYTSESFHLKDSTSLELSSINSGPMSLKGDVLIKCFQIPNSETEGHQNKEWQLLFQCQFNTCALDFGKSVKMEKLTFYKEEIDLIFADTSVDNQASIELLFLLDPPDPMEVSRKSRSKIAKPRTKSTSPISSKSVDSHIRQHSQDFSRADSYENFEKPEGGFIFRKIE
ncbi:c2 domain of PTEN tumor-suppressor protein [Ditylenchus destructor]|nr:c2 domain of PTEN tumor-suppressor protein [Ditylenchus destructor]